MKICTENCGDGIRVGSEQCDDANTNDGDCCNSQCKIEKDCACVKIASFTYDYCFKCDLGYTSSKDWKMCINRPITPKFYRISVVWGLSRNTKIISAIISTAYIYGVTSSILISVLTTASSSQSSFGMINQIQLILIIPLISAYLPDDIIDFIKAMNESLFNFKFLPTEDSSLMESIKNYFDFQQTNSYLYLLGLESGSALVNILKLSCILAIILAFHLVLIFLYYYLGSICKFNKIAKVIRLTLSFLTFGLYINCMLGTFLLFLFVDFNEIYNYNKYSQSNMRSHIASFIILLLMFLSILLTLWQWWKSCNPEKLKKQKYFIVLLSGMKPKCICRIYSLVFLIRRSIFCMIVFFMAKYRLETKLILYTVNSKILTLIYCKFKILIKNYFIFI